jgi:diguanylate cyclase (GGDEF)-like protein/PAS domain S-box-containing protein
MFWVANGLLLAYLLLAPRWRWPAYLVIGYLAFTLRIFFLRDRWIEFLFYNLLNIVEVTTAALLLRPRSTLLPRFTERAYLIRFIAYAGLAGPALAGVLYALTYPLLQIVGSPHPFINWMASDSLGTVITAPAFVAVFQARFRNPVNWRKNWFYPALLLAVAIAAFAQNSVPLVYLIFPLLVLVTVRLGLGYASLFMLCFAVIAGWFTIRGYGPFWATGSVNPALPRLLLQIAVASGVLMIYCVSVVLESQKKTEHRLQEIVTLHTLVSENSRDIILLADFDGRPLYISPAVKTVTGWNPNETMQRGFAEVAHPEDLGMIKARIRKIVEDGEADTIEYRVQKRSGGFVWVEANLHLIRDPRTGAPSGILNIVRDITERKRAEKQLQEAYHSLEALAVTDALTGLPNRRQFDQCLSREWRRGMRERKPLSMLLIDADLFKSYNDAYGHIRGDSCLKQIAESALDVVFRPGDLVARFGGEEFAVILPSTESDGAMRVAVEVCEALGNRKLAHSANPFGIVTVSIGCATMVPRIGQNCVALVELADQALYKAKRSGRNRVCNGNSRCGDPATGEASALAISMRA